MVAQNESAVISEEPISQELISGELISEEVANYQSNGSVSNQSLVIGSIGDESEKKVLRTKEPLRSLPHSELIRITLLGNVRKRTS